MKHNFICKYEPGTISQSASLTDKQTKALSANQRPSLTFLTSLPSESHLTKGYGNTPSGRDTGEREVPYKVRVPGGDVQWDSPAALC